jgi:glycosyltransferase involved in cell wall biosynthesis
MDAPALCIVLATLNGAQWLPEQLESIQQQSCRNWRLLISDDGSTDATRGIVQEFAAQDDRIVLLPARSGPPGHVANFEYLLNEALQTQMPAIFLSDQDDRWQQGKLECLLALLAKDGPEPAAAFSDLEMMNSRGKPLGSFMDSQRLRGVPSAEDLLGQNSVPGCSLAVNPALLELALPFPPGLCNHDWWLALCAAALGTLHYHPETLIAYRQHQANAIGGGWKWRRLRKASPILHRQRRVFFSKISATRVLIERLQGAGRPVPEALWGFVGSFEQASGWSLPLQLFKSEFAPRSLALRLVQMLASSPLLAGSDSVEGR